MRRSRAIESNAGGGSVADQANKKTETRQRATE
jgi:hypothetical protein